MRLAESRPIDKYSGILHKVQRDIASQKKLLHKLQVQTEEARLQEQASKEAALVSKEEASAFVHEFEDVKAQCKEEAQRRQHELRTLSTHLKQLSYSVKREEDKLRETTQEVTELVLQV